MPQREGNIDRLDNGEIDRLYKRIAELETKQDLTQILRGANNGARLREDLKLRDGTAREQGDRFVLNHKKNQRHFRQLCS